MHSLPASFRDDDDVNGDSDDDGDVHDVYGAPRNGLPPVRNLEGAWLLFIPQKFFLICFSLIQEDNIF